MASPTEVSPAGLRRSLLARSSFSTASSEVPYPWVILPKVSGLARRSTSHSLLSLAPPSTPPCPQRCRCCRPLPGLLPPPTPWCRQRCVVHGARSTSRHTRLPAGRDIAPTGDLGQSSYSSDPCSGRRPTRSWRDEAVEIEPPSRHGLSALKQGTSSRAVLAIRSQGGGKELAITAKSALPQITSVNT